MMDRWRLRFRLRLASALVAACTLLMAFPVLLNAQEDRPPGEGRGMNRGGGGRGMMMDPVVMEGPPAPDSMAGLVGLSGDGLARYSTMYQNLMTSTKPQRDSAAALRAQRMAERQGGGPDARARGGAQGMREIRQYLEDRQKQFDDALKDVLDQSQFRKYQDWRGQRRKEAEDRMREMRQRNGDGMGGPPGQ